MPSAEKSALMSQPRTARKPPSARCRSSNEPPWLPKDPSGQDRSVAAQATQTEARARIELQQERSEETEKKDERISGNQDTPETITDNRLEEQAIAAYRQTEFTTNPRQNPNSFSFNTSA